jgi:hypothetical protein
MGLKKKQLQFEEEILSDIEAEPDLPPRLRSFPLFELPSEIRLRIYHFVLFTPTRKSALQRTGNVGASAKKSKPLSPSSQRVALFLVSQKVHDEATHYFYSSPPPFHHNHRVDCGIKLDCATTELDRESGIRVT